MILHSFHFSRRHLAAGLFTAFLLLSDSRWHAAAYNTDEIEFFEKSIRPILAENCYPCHSAQAKTPMGGLRLDSREAMLKGGDSGPAITPGDPNGSLLMHAISYQDLRLKMPPKGKLSDEEIASFAAWIKLAGTEAGPVVPGPVTNTGRDSFEPARGFWCFQPLRHSELPPIKQRDWPRSAIDHFILAKLEENGLAPAPPADKRAWLRRVTFDLTGLPPTSEEVEAFFADSSPLAREKVVDRLLASPHYGERWGRHWLDLMRFAETNGHEFDNDKLDAWRYRDYVIRAFNDDVPYNQFVREHIAGDLIPEKRISRDGAHWESPLGTGSYWFGEVVNSATDSIKSRADEVDNQIDVMSKAFLGLTVACARCHDHKFDPIPTADYYGVAGIMHGTGITETVVDAPARVEQIASAHRQIADANRHVTEMLRPAQLAMARQVKAYLMAAANLIASGGPDQPLSGEDSARSQGLSPVLLKGWAACLADARKEPEHIFYPFVTVADRLLRDRSPTPEAAIAQVRREMDNIIVRSSLVHSEQKRRGDVVFEDFERLTYEGWTVSGQAFGEAPQRGIPPNQTLRGYQGQGAANSFGRGSDKLVGSLTSAKFRMPKLYVHVRMAGSHEKNAGEKTRLRLTVVADGYKSQHFVPEGKDHLEWKTVRMTKEIGRVCYFEIVDRSRDGHIVIDKIVLSDVKDPPPLASRPNKRVLALLAGSGWTTLESFAAAYQELFTAALHSPGATEPDTASLIQALGPSGRLDDLAVLLPADRTPLLAGFQRRRAAFESSIPESAFAMIARDENPQNIRLHIRGNHKNLGEEVPRRFLRIVAGRDQQPIIHGSGRLQLAEWMASPQNPLTARVMVNRIWKRHFGHGIVRSADNFGRTGEQPSHPELLDFLATRFIGRGWSVKAIHRMLAVSSTYAMSSKADEASRKIDPQNRFLHHMPVRRLEGEAIRDSILAVAGALDRQGSGPGVAPHISKYQDGRGKPDSGPLDGNRRRSVYLQVRRNFITPMFLAFDYPLPITTIGNRSVSTVPSQALMLLNNEFVALQAREWARRITAAESDPRRRIDRMYLSAFARPADQSEAEETLSFLKTQRQIYEFLPEQSASEDMELRLWADLCHVLLNSAEFIYIR